MSFGRIHDDLRTLEQKLSQGKAVTAEDVFGCIRDLCEDIRSDTGAAVEQCPPGSASALLRQLPWMGRLITRQYRRIEGQVMDMGRQQDLQQKIRELDALSDRLELLSGENEALEKQKNQLLAKQSQLEAQSGKKLELQKDCELLQERIQVLSDASIPLLEKKRAELQAESQALTLQLDQLKDAAKHEEAEKESLEEQIAGQKEVINDIHLAARDLDQQLQDVTLQTADLHKQHDQAQAKLDAQEKTRKDLEDKCLGIAERIQILTDASIPLVEKHKAELEAQCQDLLEKYEQRKAELKQEQENKASIEQQIATEQRIINDTHVEAWKLEQQFQDLVEQTREQSDQCGQLREQLQQQQTKLDEAREALRLCQEEELPKVQSELNQVLLTKEQSENLLAQLRQETQTAQTDCQTLEADRDRFAAEIKDLTARRDTLTRDKQEKSQELERLRNILKEFDDECSTLQQQLDQLVEDLSRRDREHVKESLTQAIAQKQQAISDYHDMQIQLQDQQRAIQDQALKNAAAIQQQQELKQRADRENQNTSQRILELQRECSSLKAQKEKLTHDETHLKAQVEQLESWLRSLELGQYTQRLEQLRQRNQQLWNARTALEEDLKRLMERQGTTVSELDMRLFQADFKGTEEWILFYQKLFGDTIRLLGSKEGS